MLQIIKNIASNLGFSLVVGLLVGMLLNNPALGALGGLVLHLIFSGLYRSNEAKVVAK